MSRLTIGQYLTIPFKFQYTFIRASILLGKYRRSRRNVVNTNLNEENIEGKVVIVTGGSSGMGRASAKEFAKRGAIVVIGDVDVKNGEIAVNEIQTETGNTNVKIMKLDLSDMDSVEAFANKVSEECPKIKIILNNAGIGGVPKKNVITKDGFNIHLAINHMGHFLLTNLLLENLKAEEKSRVVSMSSTMQIFANFDPDDLNMQKPGIGFKIGLPYANTKFCNSLFIKELGKRVAGTGVRAYSLCPGVVNTAIGANDTPKILQAANRAIMKKLYASPEEAASEFIMYCALDKSIENETGIMYRFRKHLKEGNKMLDDELACRLWEKSAQLVHLEERLARMPSKF